jgi:hypothetical protein
MGPVTTWDARAHFGDARTSSIGDHRSDRCGGGDGMPPRELTYPTERLGVQSAWTALRRVRG